MPNHIALTDLNDLRFPKSPRPLTTLRHQARNGRLPGAFQLGGAWMLDLDVFDAEIAAQIGCAAANSDTQDEAIAARALEIQQRLTRGAHGTAQ